MDKVHADGAYQSKDNRELAADKENGFDFVANGIQGKPSRFDFDLQEDGTIQVTDKQTAEAMTAIKVKDDKWKISVKTKDGKDTYRYFDKTSVERSKVRRNPSRGTNARSGTTLRQASSNTASTQGTTRHVTED